MTAVAPNLFSLMARLTVEERQKLGERRRAMKAREGIHERLVQSEQEWRLEYWQGRKKIGSISVTSP